MNFRFTRFLNYLQKIKYYSAITLLSYLYFKHNKASILINNSNPFNLIEIQALNLSDIPLNKPILFDYYHGNNLYKIVIIKKSDNKCYALLGQCPNDNSLLDNASVFGNVLISNNGIFYNIESGVCENNGLYNLPIFSTKIKDNKLYIYFPNKIPKKVRPFIYNKEHYDNRKIVIIGSGNAGIGCAEGLRQMGFTGHISILTKELTDPIKKDKLNNYYGEIDDKELLYRGGNVDNKLNINIYNSKEAANFYLENEKYFIETESDEKIEFDALIVASGDSNKVINYEGLTVEDYDYANTNKRIFTLNDLYNKSEFIKLLKTYENPNINIIGYNWESIKIAGNLKRAYPISVINIIDDNKKIAFAEDFGPEVNKLMKDHLKSINVNVITQKKILRFSLTNKNTNDKIILKNGTKINNDILILSSNDRYGNTDFIKNTKFAEDIELNNDKKIEVDHTFSTFRKRVFAAGNCCQSHYNYASGFIFDRKKDPLTNYNEGYYTSMNVLGLDIPNPYLPYYTITSFFKKIYIIGYHCYYEKLKILGDTKTDNYLILYTVKDKIVSAISSETQKTKLDVIYEAIKTGVNLNIDKMDFTYIQELKDQIEKNNKSKCYREELFQLRVHPLGNKILWREKNLIPDDLNDQLFDKDEAEFDLLKTDKILS